MKTIHEQVVQRETREWRIGNNPGDASQSTLSSVADASTLPDAQGNTLRLFLPDFDPLDQDGYFLGNEPLMEDE